MYDIFYNPFAFVGIYLLGLIILFLCVRRNSHIPLKAVVASITIIVLIVCAIYGVKASHSTKFYEVNGTKLIGETTHKEMDEYGYFLVKVKDTEGSIYNLKVSEDTFEELEIGKVQTLYRWNTNVKVAE